jgi:gliding motility-associated-like protein
MKNLTSIIAVLSLVLFSFENARAQCGATGVTADPQPEMICEGNSTLITFTPSGACAGNYEYEVLAGATIVQAWSTTSTFNAAPLTTTIYTVNLRCSGCPAIVVWANFTVEVIEEPTVNGILSICPGEFTTLTASGSTGNLSWWNAASGGAQLSPTDVYTTPALSTDATYYVTATGSFGGGGGSILITECGLDGAIGGTGSEDYIEISNLYTTPVNTTGWTVAVSSSYTNINSSNATTWSLPASFPACSVVTRTDANGTGNYWGNNIFWNSTSNSWAIIIDDSGNVVDFIAWGWTAAQLATFNPTINGFSVNLGAEWVGNGCPLPCGSTGGVQYSFARTGSADNNVAGDFVCQPTSVDLVNPGLSCGWIVGVSCPYPVDVLVSGTADATIAPAGPYCALDLPVNLSAVDAGGTWSGAGITDPVLGTFDPSLAVAGPNTITYDIPGACGDIQTYDIVIDPALSAVITPTGPFCQTEPAILMAAMDAGGTWSGMGITDPMTGAFDPAVAGPGIHTITYDIPGACGDLQTFDIEIFGLLNATISPSGPHCESDPAVILAAFDAGGTWSGIGITNPVTGEFDPGVAGGGLHTITYTIPGACGDVQTVIIEVYDQLSAVITPVGPFCEYDAAIMMNAVDAGGTWSGTGITNAVSGTFNPGTAGAGLHTITYEIAGGCGDLQTYDILVHATPIVNFVADNIVGCAPVDVTFTNLSTPLGSSNVWSFGNLDSSWMTTGPTTTYNTPDCFDVTLTVTQNGCTNSLTIQSLVCVQDVPDAGFLVNSVGADIFDPEFIFSNTSTNADTYFWDFGDDESSSLEDPIHMYPQVASGYDVCLIASNSIDESCADTICVPITVDELLIYYLPNTFTPDGDSYNEYFQPIFTSGYDPYDFNMFIYNRWGEIIWESHDSTVGWDGTYGGGQKIAQDGTYTWKIDFKTSKNDERVMSTGSVNIIR